MLTDEQLVEVKDEYLRILRQLKREDCDVEGFIEFLESTDFFTAPASQQYHCSFPGGLCLHSINVYKILHDITYKFAKKSINNPKFVQGGKEPEKITVPYYSEDTIILVGLLHDLSKINLYEKIVKNEKVYCEDGDKSDNLGKFKWRGVNAYATKQVENRINLGLRGVNTYLKASEFFSLSEEEMNTLIYQYSATDKEPIPDLSHILARNNLAVYLHASDIISTYCIEK